VQPPSGHKKKGTHSQLKINILPLRLTKKKIQKETADVCVFKNIENRINSPALVAKYVRKNPKKHARKS